MLPLLAVGLSGNQIAAWLVNRLVVCGDCNRPTLDTLRTAGFAISEVVRTELPGAPPFARPLVVGNAVNAPVPA